MMSDSEEGSICFICESAESNSARLIECAHCNRSVHFRCKKIFGNAVRKVKKKQFFCSIECTEMYTRINQQHTEFEEVINELRLLGQSVREAKQESAHTRIAFEQARLQIVTLVETTKNIEESQQFLSNQFETLKTDVNVFKEEVGDLREENNKIREEVRQWHDKHDELSATVGRLELQLDRSNRASLSKNAIVLGLPEAGNENTRELILKLGLAIGCNMDPDAILSSRRLYSRGPSRSTAPILISFNSEDSKEEFFAHKRSHGVLLASAVSDACVGSTQRVTIRDELTDFGRELLREAKEMQTKLNVKYVWPGRNGKILLKRYDGAKVEQVSSKQELLAMARTSSKRVLDSSGNSSLTFSPPLEPRPKRHANI